MELFFHQNREAIQIRVKGRMADSDRHILITETQKLIEALTLSQPIYLQLHHFHLSDQNLFCLHKIYTMCQQARCSIHFVTRDREQYRQLRDRGLPVHQDTPNTEILSPHFY